MTERRAQPKVSAEPVPLKDVLKQLVDADFPALSEEEAARKAAANRLDAERLAQEAREQYADLQQIPWEEEGLTALHDAGQRVFETQEALKSPDPRP